MIKCQICKQRLSAINHSHLVKHGLTMAEYRKTYPDAPLQDRKCRSKRAKTMKKVWKDPDYLENQIQKSSENWQVEGFREKTSRAIRKARSTPEAKQEQSRRTTNMWQDPEYRARQSQILHERWLDPDYRKHLSKIHSEKWQDPEYRKKQAPLVDKWTKPEKSLRRMLKKLGVYRSGSRTSGTTGFLPHRWLPTVGSKWRGRYLNANGDFVDYNHHLIIHVDGPWHYDPKMPRYSETKAHDQAVDHWCLKHGWSFIRLTDLDIYHKPAMCRNMVRQLIRGS